MRGQDVFYLALTGLLVGGVAYAFARGSDDEDENSDGKPDSWTDRADPTSSRNVVNVVSTSPAGGLLAVAARAVGLADDADDTQGGILANIRDALTGRHAWVNSSYSTRRHPAGHVFLIEVRADGKAARITSQRVANAWQRLPTPEPVTGWQSWPVISTR